jgi:hypothetical protein
MANTASDPFAERSMVGRRHRHRPARRRHQRVHGDTAHASRSPPVRAHVPRRSQIEHGTDRRPLHLAQRAVRGGPSP